MQDADSIQDKPIADRNSASSSNRLIDNSTSDNLNRDQSFALDTKTKDDAEKTKKKRQPTPSPIPLQSPTDKPTFSGPFGISVASTIFWYVCICILFVIAFVSLVLSVLYFVTDTSKEQVVKLYGICGSGTLAIVTFVIIFLDCCNDSSRKEHEQEMLYRTMQEREQKKKEIALRRKRRIAEGKEQKPKPFIIQHQRVQKVEKEPTPPPPPPHHHHHHIHPPLFPPPTSYHHPFVCPICHDLHASGNARHNFNDIGVDTSDKFAPAPKTNRIIHKSTRDAQTEPKYWDSERGTQTDRTEGTQTTAMELSGMPSNITQIIHETTILKAPRSLIGTLKKSMAQQDKDIAINHAVTNTYTSPATFT